MDRHTVDPVNGRVVNVWRWLCTILALVALVLVMAGLLVAVGQSRAHAVKAHKAHKVNRCWSAGAHPESDLSYRCQTRGWRIAPRVVVNPHGIARVKIRSCSTDEGEEGRSCYWNARRSGNGRGVSYIYIARDDAVWYGIVRINGHDARGRY